MSVETAFISSIRSMDEYIWAVSRGIELRHFADQQDAWSWFVSYVNRSSSIPPSDMTRQHFVGDFELDVIGDVRYHFDELYKDFISRTIRATVYNAASSITADPLGALDSIIGRLIEVQRNESPNFSYYDHDATERYESVLKRRKELSNDVSGIPTGIEVIDIQRYGWQPGEFSAFVARPGAGKSELLALSAITAMESGRRVLVVSAEMTREKFMLRMDPILARQRNIPLTDFPTNRQLVSAMVDDDVLAKYAQFTESLTSNNAALVIDQQGRKQNFTVDEIASIARNHRADLVIIDGLKLLRVSGGRSSSIERYQEIVKSCHDYAQADRVVVLAAEHTQRTVDSNKMPDLNQVFNGDTLPQFAERIITMMVPTGRQYERYIAVQKSRDGGPLPKRKTISFNPDIGDVGRWIDPIEVKLDSELRDYVASAPNAVTARSENIIESYGQLDLG